MIIYCAHIYGGEEENKQKVESIVKELQLSDTSNTYFSPIHAFGFVYKDVEYTTGLQMCLDILERADVLLVCSKETSKGVDAETALATILNIPIYELEEWKAIEPSGRIKRVFQEY